MIVYNVLSILELQLDCALVGVVGNSVFFLLDSLEVLL